MLDFRENSKGYYMEKFILHIHDTHPNFQYVRTLIPAVERQGVSVSVHMGQVLYTLTERGSDMYEGEVALYVLRTRARGLGSIVLHLHEHAPFFREIHSLIPFVEQRGVSISRRDGLFLYAKGKHKDHVYQGDMALCVLRGYTG